MIALKVELKDTWSNDSTKIPCDLEFDSGTIWIRPEGYGDCSSQNGYGWPIKIEYYSGSIRVCVWSDINNDDPTHVIFLDGAKESLRKQ